jgi:type IV pilus assembly protein PilA
MTASALKPQLRHALLSKLNSKRSGKQNALQKGFTLVELMIVIVIVGILSAVALPNFLSQTEKAKGTEAKSKISAFLKQGHAEWQEAGSTTETKDLTDADANGKFTYAATSPAADADPAIFSVIASAKTGETAGADASLQGKKIFGCVNLQTGEQQISSQLQASDASSDANVTCGAGG